MPTTSTHETDQGAPGTRERLLAAAAAEFLEHGYERASLRRICAEAGVTTGALYFVFKNKDDLFRAVVAPLVDPAREVLLASAASREERIPAFGDKDQGVFAAGGVFADPYDVHGVLSVCYEHRDIVHVLFSCRDAPYEQELEQGVADFARDDLLALIRLHDAPAEIWDDFMVRWYSRVIAQTFADVLEADETLEGARAHLEDVVTFIYDGTASLLEPRATAPASGEAGA